MIEEVDGRYSVSGNDKVVSEKKFFGLVTRLRSSKENVWFIQ